MRFIKFIVLLSLVSSLAKAEVLQGERKLKEITLANKLKVLLISDPKVNKPAAAMDVAVGFIAESPEHPGLAHFLEHMLFLGTTKYPKPGEFQEFIKASGGLYNGSTWLENTNYFFEVLPEAFEEAIDRFSGFFISPLFQSEFAEKEINAIQSEYQIHSQTDSLRSLAVSHHLAKAEHPLHHFHIGNKESLKNVSQDVLLDFYHKYYSANQMRLTVIAKDSLASLETLVKEKFSAIANSDREKLVYSSDVFEAGKLPRLMNIQPINNQKTLTLSFQLPELNQFWESQPATFLSELISYKENGSLSSLLKNENLATGINATVEQDSSFRGTLDVTLYLTDSGLEQVEKVIGHFFTYINFLKNNALPRHFFEDQKNMRKIDFDFRPHQEGLDLAKFYARNMHIHPGESIDERTQLVHKYSDKDFQYLLSFVKPKTLQAYLLAEQKKSVDYQSEPLFAVKYRVEQFPDNLVTEWSHSQPSSEFSFPEKNPFIPDHLEVRSSKTRKKAQKIMDNQWGSFWFQQDDTFHQPRSFMTLKLVTPETNKSLQHTLLATLYTWAMEETLKEWTQKAQSAGIEISVSTQELGVSLDFQGYNSWLGLVEDLAKRLRTINISEETFLNLKADLKEQIGNTSKGLAIDQGLRKSFAFLSANSIDLKDSFKPEEGIDLIEPVRLLDLQNYASHLYQKIGISGVAYGSISQEEAMKAIHSVLITLQAQPLERSQWPRIGYHLVPANRSLFHTFSVQTPGNAWMKTIQISKHDLKAKAALSIGMSKLDGSFFRNLRTQQQLGYNVQYRPGRSDLVEQGSFLIQSAYDPIEIEQRFRAWAQDAIRELEELTDDQFLQLKEAVIQQFSMEETTMGQRFVTLLVESLDLNQEFNHKLKIAAEAKNISKDELVEFFKTFFNSSGSLSIYTYGKKNQPMSSAEYEVVDSPQDFQAKIPILWHAYSEPTEADEL